MVPETTKSVARVEPRREDGIFLGVSDRSDELYAGTERGMHKVRTLRRREPTERVHFPELCVGKTLGECERRASCTA